jgi:hypothetical protein
MKEKTQHHDFFKQFKEKWDLIEYLDNQVPEAEKRPFGEPGMCCGWCHRPISEGVKIGENTYSGLCLKCFELASAWNKEKGVEY